MNVNGARFHLLLGSDDWRRCRAVVEGDERALGAIWDGAAAAGLLPAAAPGWDRLRQEVTLAPLPVTLPLTRGEPILGAANRRGAVADRFDNLYVVAEDRRSLLVEAAGPGQTASRFWPDDRDQPATRSRRRIFVDAVAAPAAAPWLGPLAITSDAFLVAIQGTGPDRAEGLLRFDLVSGGPPETLLFPAGFAPDVADIAPDRRGGLWLLDRGGGGRPAGLFQLDQQLVPIPGATAAPRSAVFSPVSGPPRTLRPAAPPLGMALPQLTAPTALAALGEALLLLDAPEAGPAQLFCLDAGASAPRRLGPLPGPAFALAVRELPATQPSPREAEALVAVRSGNQAWRVRLEWSEGAWQSRLEADVVPLRRFGGRALVRRGEAIVYDSGPAPMWVPALAQRRRRLATTASFTTPAWDGAEPQCVWDRLRLDASIPAGTAVRVEARASDRAADLASGDAGWIPQPVPYLNRDGGELPGKGRAAMAPTDAAMGRGCWDLLLQGMVGRYLQLRVSLSGDGRFTPRLRALRAWYPRVSWTRFLPAIYRGEPGPAEFLDRFLANMEGLSSGIEGRIAAAQALLDPRTAPAESLDWLAGWLDTALDPAWNEERRRLFLAHAATFYAWRGTLPGLSLALRLALDPTLSAQELASWDGEVSRHAWERAGGIRIIEASSVRRGGRSWPLAADAAVADAAVADVSGPGARNLAGRWQPEDGGAGLWERWGQARGAPVGASERLAGVDLGGIGSDVALWRRFATDQFGFVPAVGAAERSRWQRFAASLGQTVSDQPWGEVPTAIADAWARFMALPSPLLSRWRAYLAARHRGVRQLNGAWGSTWADLGEIPLPDHLPERAAACRDWLTFEGQILPRAASAHRFSVLLPRTRLDHDPAAEAAELALASRITALEKPAHTLFDIRFYWAMNRVGEARLGLDSQLGPSSRAPALLPAMVLGRGWLGGGFVGGPPASAPQDADTVRRQRLC